MLDPDTNTETTILQDIIEAQRAEDACERVLITLKEQLKEAKEEWLDARDRRVSLVRHADQGRLQFGDVA